VVALVEDHVKVADSPCWMKVEDAWRVTVGRVDGATAGAGVAGGGASGACFLQAAAKATTTIKVLNKALLYLLVRIIYFLPPLTIGWVGL
jgi:hypothetical protein